MKKTLVFTLILTLMLSVVSIVSATETTTPTGTKAEVAVPSTAKEGETIKVTVDLKAELRTGVIWVSYDDTKLELTGTPEGIKSGINTRELGKDTAGKTGVYFAGPEATDTVSKVTFTFKVIGKVDETATVTVTGEKFYNTVDGKQEAVAIEFPAAETVTIEAAKPADDQPQDEPKVDEPENKTDEPTVGSDAENKDTGKTPTRFPQTGVNVGVVGGVVLLAVVAGYVVTKRD